MIIRHPFRRSIFLRVNDHYDNQDIVVENPSTDSSRNHLFKDLPRVNQLTQNGWNFSPYTRENAYNPVTAIPERVPRNARYRGILDPSKYQDPH